MSNLLIEKAVFQIPDKVKKYTGDKVIFEAYLQEAELQNQNKRVYPKNVLVDAINKINDKISRRSFLGELDHPISTNQIRQTTVLYKEVSHIIREVSWEGNLLRGIIETTPYTSNGKTLGGLVLDRVTVGFSLRGLADVQDSGGSQVVMAPLIMIGYDSVSEPSNNKATIQEIRNESLVQVVHESRNIICTSDGHCYLPDLFDQLVERKILTLKKKWS
jgi:hypothetical protein